MRKLVVGITLMVVLSLGVMPGLAQDTMMSESGFAYYATTNPAELANDSVISFTPDLMGMSLAYGGFSAPVTSLESLDYAADGTGYLTFDAADGTGGIVELTGIPEAPLLGANTMLMAPKGLEVIDSLGVVAVANFGGNNILTFPIGATGDTAPSGVIDDLGGAGSVWDVIFDPASGTLFAAGTAGDVLVYEGYPATMTAMAPERIISPSNAAGEKISINLHGLIYLSEDDVLILSDVGAADNNADGHLYVIENASTADGNTPVALHITGAASRLGNPVDLLWDGTGLYVAEKANDAILYFPNLLDWTGMMDAAPAMALAVTKPESLAATEGMVEMMPPMATEEMAATDMPMATDMPTLEPTAMPTTEPTMMATEAPTEMAAATAMPTEAPAAASITSAGTSLVVATNPGDLSGDTIRILGDALTSVGGFAGISSIQSVKFDPSGNAYMTVDVSEGVGGIIRLDGLADAGGGALGDISSMVNTSSALNGPKGIDIAESLGVVLVANTGAGNIRGFSLDNVGTFPVIAINNLGGVAGSVWDVHYDETNDILFAAGTTGTLLVYTSFSTTLGINGPTRLIVPADVNGNPISVNLHGVDYDAATDTVILSDVGSADSNTDGQIFVISQVTFANGATPVRARISGAATMLGNPVDIVLDGGSLYVAEKANDAVLRYDNILSLEGAMDVAADAMVSVVKPESVQVWG